MLDRLVQGRGIAPHIPVIDKSERKDGTFERSDFTYDAYDDAYTCPGGKKLQQFRRTYKVPRSTSFFSKVHRQAWALATICSGCQRDWKGGAGVRYYLKIPSTLPINFLPAFATFLRALDAVFLPMLTTFLRLPANCSPTD